MNMPTMPFFKSTLEGKYIKLQDENELLKFQIMECKSGATNAGTFAANKETMRQEAYRMHKHDLETAQAERFKAEVDASFANRAADRASILAALSITANVIAAIYIGVGI